MIAACPPPTPGDLVGAIPQVAATPPARRSLLGLDRPALHRALQAIGVPERALGMRAKQLWHWIYARGESRFEAMTSVSQELRAELAAAFTVKRPQVVTEQVSIDGTRKWLLRLLEADGTDRGHEVECVFIPEADRGTLCLSSQVGCTLTCAFCHTGTQRWVRNLRADEIVGQILLARDRLG